MAKKTQRVFAFTAAVLFLVTSVGFSIAVIYEMTHQKNQDQNQAAQTPQNQNASKGKPMDNYTPVAEVTELQKNDLVVGNGKEVQATDMVTMHYTLALAKDGLIIQTSKDTGQPVPIELGTTVPGFTQGVTGMKVGGQRRILIPGALGYGEPGNPDAGIPPNAALVFDVEVVDTAPASEAPQTAPQQ